MANNDGWDSALAGRDNSASRETKLFEKRLWESSFFPEPRLCHKSACLFTSKHPRGYLSQMYDSNEFGLTEVCKVCGSVEYWSDIPTAPPVAIDVSGT